MSDTNTASFGDLFKQAKADGSLTDDTLPDGDFTIKIERANGAISKNGNARIGYLAKITAVDPDLGDPKDVGKVAWQNLHFSPKAAPISFKALRQLGVADEAVAASGSVEDVAQFLPGIEFEATITHWGDDNQNNNIKLTKLLAGPVGAGRSSDDDPVDAEVVEEELAF